MSDDDEQCSRGEDSVRGDGTQLRGVWFLWACGYAAYNSVVFTILGVYYSRSRVVSSTGRNGCGDTTQLVCTHFRHDIALACFFVVLCCLFSSAELMVIAPSRWEWQDIAKRLLTPVLFTARHMSAPARRFMIDVAVVIGAATLLATLGAVSHPESRPLPTVERWLVAIVALTTIASILLGVIANWHYLKIHVTGLIREAVTASVILIVVLGHNWAGWTWSGIAISAGIVAGVNALGQWLIPGGSATGK